MGREPDLAGAFDFLSDIFAAPTVLRNERTICVDEPPTVPLTGGQALNFIFLGEDKYFLR
jgi:hypothetical protein